MIRDLSFYKSALSEEIRAEGRAQGRKESILLVLRRRGIHIPKETRDRIGGCHDPEIQRRRLVRAVTAPTLKDVFAGG